ncbi:MAG: glutamyl-tRNA reductase [Longimicrobiales bacterium]
MSLVVVGLSHHTAPLEVRERFALSDQRAGELLARVTEAAIVAEAVVLSTCNRTELYAVLPGTGAAAGTGRLVEVLCDAAAYHIVDASRYFYTRAGGDAARHLFRVVSSLDSMVVGEAQIQGQVRDAYQLAAAQPTRAAGAVLSRLFEAALHVGARVRSETSLATGAASVPSAAVDLARKIFGPLRGRHALVLGAGEMSELALACLVDAGVASVAVASRTEARARALTGREGVRALPIEQLGDELPRVDIIACATAAPHHVLTRELVEHALANRPRRPLFIIDMALPRDVEPSVGELDNVFLYDIDDLRQIVDANLERRARELPAAERIVEEATDAFRGWHATLDVVPVIRGLREDADALRRAEVERTLRRMPGLSAAERQEIDALTRRLMRKLLHDPTVRLRESAAAGRGAEMVETVRELFGLTTHDRDRDRDRETGRAMARERSDEAPVTSETQGGTGAAGASTREPDAGDASRAANATGAGS